MITGQMLEEVIEVMENVHSDISVTVVIQKRLYKVIL